MEQKSSQLVGRGLYHVTSNQIKDYILTYFGKESILLGNVDNTSDLDKPVSTLTQTALDKKLSKTDPYVQSINQLTGNIVVTSATVGLDKVNNTSDSAKPVSIATQTELNKKVNLDSFNSFKTYVTETLKNKVDDSQTGVSSGVATLDTNGQIFLTQIPTLDKTKVISSQTTDQLSKTITVSVKNDVLGSFSFNGSAAAVDLNATLSNTGVAAGSYGTSVKIPSLIIDEKGRITGAKEINIEHATTVSAGIVKLNNTVSSTSTLEAPTANALKTTYDLAYQANIGSLKTDQRGVPNGVATLDANGRVPVTQLPETGSIVADRLSNLRSIKTTGDATWSVTFNGSADVSSPIVLTNVLTNPGDFGASTHTPYLSLDSKGRVTKASLVKIAPAFDSIVDKPNTVSGYGIEDVYTKAQVDAAINNALSMTIPSGIIAYFGARSAPNGWLACEGQAISRTTYAGIFKVIGTTFGSGDGTTTFNLPDGRGEFIRGWDNGKGVDPSRGFGTNQTEMLKSHNHTVRIGPDVNTVIVPNNTKTVGVSNADNQNGQVINGDWQISSTGGTETRPRNISFLQCIKI